MRRQYRRPLYAPTRSRYAAWKREAVAARAILQAEAAAMADWTEEQRDAYFEQLVRRTQEKINA
jgi:hypothetical protein